MDLALINQKTSYEWGINLSAYLENLKKITLETNVDILVGPELALSGDNRIMPFSLFKKYIKGFASGLEGKLIVPGTGLVREGNLMRNVVPIILKDGRIVYHSKNSSHYEDPLSKKNGLEYERGSVKDGVFDKEKPSFVVEICRDHGLGKLKNFVRPSFDFHFILSNNLGGIFPDKTLVKEGWIVALVDGKESESSAYIKKNGSLLKLDEFKKEDYTLIKL